jgi:uncharacterized protein YbgA (DUF1722 family)/uncharacterized protein YbbK (DUF523 family)
MSAALPLELKPWSDRPVVGVSVCLLGEEVRTNGGHCRSRFLTHELGRHVDWFTVCPEVEVGLGVPRPVLRLVGDEDDPRLVVTDTGEDLTARMRVHTQRRLGALDDLAVDGWVLKKDSPTCGVFRVKVYDEGGSPSRRSRGLFAGAVADRFPHLPLEEEGRLNDPPLRENFVLRVFARHRWRRYVELDGSVSGLMQFHAENKFLLLAHAPVAYRELGRLVAGAGRDAFPECLERYGSEFILSFARPASRARHVNVLQHLAGFLKGDLDAEDKLELGRLVASYRAGEVPLVVPLTLLRHLLRRHDASGWARAQTYLEPYPADLMLRNQV